MRIVMPSCPCPQTLPAFVNSILMANWTLILDWCSQQIYAHLIQRDSQHLLVCLQSRLKFTAVEAACAAFHHADGAGAPPSHPSSYLARALLVGHLYDWSLRQLEWQIRYNLIVKWFVGYPIFADGPDHATLERFQLWIAEHQPRAIFDDVLRQIDAFFPQERSRDQVGDTYALRANAAKESLVHLIRHACRRLLAVLHSADVERHACVLAALDRSALFGAADEHRDWYLTDAQRAARVQTTVLAALDCTRLVRAQLAAVPALPSELTRPILDWLDRLDKIIADEVILTLPDNQAIGVTLTAPAAAMVDTTLPSAPDHPLVSPHTPAVLPSPALPAILAPTVTQRPAPVKGAYRIGSATDPDATYRVHTHTKQAGKTDLGYNANVLVSADAVDPLHSDALGGAFIREVHVDTGAQPDAVALPDLLLSQR